MARSTLAAIVLATWVIAAAGADSPVQPSGGNAVSKPEAKAANPPVDVAAMLRSLPDVTRYKVDPYIRAAVELQALGKDKAIAELTALDPLGADRNSIRSFVLCRMLFVKKAGQEFRLPGLGLPVPLGGSDYKDWELSPIEVMDGVPFWIVNGYMLGGEPESASQYLQYCIDNCDWNPEPFNERTADEKQAALTRLLDSPKFKRPLTRGESDMLRQQIR